MKVLIIIPAYNEEKNILQVVKEIEKNKEKNIDYIVINDGSKDNTLDILIKNKIKHINLVNNLGIGAAVQTGYIYAKNNNYDVAIQFDGDGQHDFEYVNTILMEMSSKKKDMVIGSRFINGKSDFLSTKSRRIGINIISMVIRLFSKQKIKDTTSGFRAVNKKIIEEFSKSYPFDYPEPITNMLVLKKGYNVSEIQVNMRERKFGKSSIRFIKSLAYMLNVTLSVVIIGLESKEK